MTSNLGPGLRRGRLRPGSKLRGRHDIELGPRPSPGRQTNVDFCESLGRLRLDRDDFAVLRNVDLRTVVARGLPGATSGAPQCATDCEGKLVRLGLSFG